MTEVGEKHKTSIGLEPGRPPMRASVGLTALALLMAGVVGCASQPTASVGEVEGLQWGVGKDNTLMGSLAAALDVAGQSVTYDFLMGTSGAAFSVRFDRTNWWPAAADPTSDLDAAAAALRSVGFSSESLRCDAAKPEEAERARQAIVASIGRGVPAVGLGLRSGADWGVIAGYGDDGKMLLCRTYYDEGEGYSKAAKWPSAVVVIGEKTGPPDWRTVAAASLETAVKVVEAQGSGDCPSGAPAYEAWMAGLQDDAAFEGLSHARLDELTRANGRSFASLTDSRAAAARYLRSVALLFNAGARAHALNAANAYRGVASRLREAAKHVPQPLLGDRELWTSQMRRAEAAALYDAEKLEKKAVSELEQALEAERGVQSTTQ